MKKCRVLHVVNSMNMGGIENFVMNTYRKISNDFQFDFLYFTEDHTYFDDEIAKRGGKIYRVTSRSQNIIKHIRECYSLFYKEKFDVVHIHSYAAFCVSVAIIAKVAGQKKVIIHSHNVSSHHKIIHNILKPLLNIYADVYMACSVEAGRWMFTKKIQKKNSYY